MLVPNLFSAFKGTSIIRNILATMSLLLWSFFTYELYFLKGTSNQGSISPTILTIVSFLLVFNFVLSDKEQANEEQSKDDSEKSVAVKKIEDGNYLIFHN